MVEKTSLYFEFPLIIKVKRKLDAFVAQTSFIAAIAAHYGFFVATRGTSPFEAAGVGVINPWK